MYLIKIPHHPVCMPVCTLTFLHLISPSPCMRACVHIDLFALDFPITLYARLCAHWPFCTWFPHHPVCMPVCALTFLHLISVSPCAHACACIDLFALDFPITLCACLCTHWPFCTWFPHHPVCAPVHASVRTPVHAPVCALTFLHLISPSPCVRTFACIDLFALDFPITLSAHLCAPAEFWLVRILEGPHHIQSYFQHLTT